MSASELNESARRRAELETALAHLERNFDSLSSMVVEQGKVLVRLQKRLELLDEAFKQQEQDLEQSPAHNVKPPHYSP
jgi:uncharacterized coiled-coil protein SlyX